MKTTSLCRQGVIGEAEVSSLFYGGDAITPWVNTICIDLGFPFHYFVVELTFLEASLLAPLHTIICNPLHSHCLFLRCHSGMRPPWSFIYGDIFSWAWDGLKGAIVYCLLCPNCYSLPSSLHFLPSWLTESYCLAILFMLYNFLLNIIYCRQYCAMHRHWAILLQHNSTQHYYFLTNSIILIPVRSVVLPLDSQCKGDGTVGWV